MTNLKKRKKITNEKKIKKIYIRSKIINVLLKQKSFQIGSSLYKENQLKKNKIKMKEECNKEIPLLVNKINLLCIKDDFLVINLII